MDRGQTGRGVQIGTPDEPVLAFVPSPLPPTPDIDLSGAVRTQAEAASVALGRLDGLASVIPDKALFLYSYVRKEAVLSSQIEGTQSTLDDLLLFEEAQTPGAPVEDVSDVSNYVSAIEHGVSLLRNGLPISARLLKEMHGVLLSSGRGESKDPGEFRRSQNWIGGTRPGTAHFVPPPATEVAQCFSDLERFIHARGDGIPHIVRAGLAHVQFETIHPFLDGNGRVGRMLVTLMLQEAGVLNEPLLYLSLYLKRHRSRYYELLGVVRRTGDWEAWLSFFLEGVRESAEDAISTARRVMLLHEADRVALAAVPRRAGTLLRVHEALKRRPVASISTLSSSTGLSFTTTSSAMDQLSQLGLVLELTGKERRKVYAYQRYLALLRED